MGSDVTTRRRRRTELLLLLICLLCGSIAALVVTFGLGSVFGSGSKGTMMVATGTGVGGAEFASSNGASNGGKGSAVPGVADSNGNGNGNTDPASGCNSHGSCNGLPKDFGVSVGSVPGLYPGRSTTIPVRYANPYSFAISVIAASASVEGNAACPGTYVSVGSYAGTAGIPVARNGTVDTELPIRLKPSAPDACQGAHFTITVTAQAVKS